MELERNGAVSCSHIFPYTAILLLVSLDVPVVYRIDVQCTRCGKRRSETTWQRYGKNILLSTGNREQALSI